MSSGKEHRVFAPLGQAMQLGDRAYEALLGKIVSGETELGSALPVDSIASQLEISTTPVREALHRLEKDGLVTKVPYQGWFVRAFEAEEVRELYELRAGMECFGIRLACQRITAEELEWLHQHQRRGEADVEHSDMTAYWAYNRDFHAAVLRAAKNTRLVSIMGPLALQLQILTGHTVRLSGRPRHGVEEHRELIARLEARDAKGAEALMERHILSALEDLLRHRAAGVGAARPPVR